MRFVLSETFIFSEMSAFYAPDAGLYSPVINPHNRPVS